MVRRGARLTAGTREATCLDLYPSAPVAQDTFVYDPWIRLLGDGEATMAEHSSFSSTFAYVLINTEPRQTASVLERLQAIPNSMAREVSGPYDIILELQADGPEYIVKILREKVRVVAGVTNTITCTWVQS